LTKAHTDLIQAAGPYSEPFNAECRAYGRLKEAHREELSVKCFGYILLDDAHEKSVMEFSPKFRSDFGFVDDVIERRRNGTMRREPGDEFHWANWIIGPSGKRPPIRGILKEFGSEMLELDETGERLRPHSHDDLGVLAPKLLQDVIKLQQLGILSLDLEARQFINGRVADFSTAVTTPHYLVTPTPNLTPEQVSTVDLRAFQFGKGDFDDFDIMVEDWNQGIAEGDPGTTVSAAVRAFPNHGSRHDDYPLTGVTSARARYNFRITRARQQRVYTLVDPRRYNWKEAVDMDKAGRGRVLKRRRRLLNQPPRWYLDCDHEQAVALQEKRHHRRHILQECILKGSTIIPI
jgi:hypothetical protein